MPLAVSKNVYKVQIFPLNVLSVRWQVSTVIFQGCLLTFVLLMALCVPNFHNIIKSVTVRAVLRPNVSPTFRTATVYHTHKKYKMNIENYDIGPHYKAVNMETYRAE